METPCPYMVVENEKKITECEKRTRNAPNAIFEDAQLKLNIEM